jgi:hypothetical protein
MSALEANLVGRYPAILRVLAHEHPKLFEFIRKKWQTSKDGMALSSVSRPQLFVRQGLR